MLPTFEAGAGADATDSTSIPGPMRARTWPRSTCRFRRDFRVAGGRIVFLQQVRFEHDCSTFAGDRRLRPLWKIYYYHRNLLMLYRVPLPNDASAQPGIEFFARERLPSWPAFLTDQ